MTDISQSRLDANWRAISAELDAPAPARIERILVAVKLPRPVVRMVVATPALRRSWYLSILAVAIVGIAPADPTSRDSLFALLVLAPLLPVLGVALAYGTAADPAHEIQLATPMHGLKLITTRAITVLLVSIGVVLPLGALNQAVRPMAFAWLLPAFAVTAASLAVMTKVSPRRATAGVAAGWLGIVVASRVIADDPLAAFAAVGQLAALGVALVGVLVTFMRRAHLESLELAR